MFEEILYHSIVSFNKCGYYSIYKAKEFNVMPTWQRVYNRIHNNIQIDKNSKEYAMMQSIKNWLLDKSVSGISPYMDKARSLIEHVSNPKDFGLIASLIIPYNVYINSYITSKYDEYILSNRKV
jgi:hypothetical protein